MSLVTPAASKADAARQELLLEQRRLAKLWDAFKKQEDEYRAIERERDDLWSRVQTLEKATSAIGDPAETLERLTGLERDNEKLRSDVAELGDLLESNRAEFEREQERLAKLYKVYEDAQLKLDATAKQLERWHRFWHRYAHDLPPKVAEGAVRTTGAKLSPKQLAQRKYAARVKSLRKRAAKAPGGKGPIRQRPAAKKLRAELGLATT